MIRPVTACLPFIIACFVLAGCSTVQYPAPGESRSTAEGPRTATTPAQPTAPPGNTATTRKGGAYYQDDGPLDTIPPNLAEIPDAVPRAEPLLAAANRPYVALGASFTPMRNVQPFTQTGIGSWYGKKFHGAKTSSGERYDMFAMTAAHPTLPIPSYARVTNLDNGRSVVVRVNDRGPFLRNRIIDLSYVAAWKLGYINQGSGRLQVDSIVPDELDNFIASIPAIQEPVSLPAQAPVPATVAAAGAPAAAPLTTASAPMGTPSGGIFLQLGAFNSPSNAEAFRDYVLSELKWLQQEIRTELVGDRYRLQVGPFRDATEARSVGEQIAARIRVQPFLVQR